MAVNSTGDFIRSVFPSIVNRRSEIFEAVFANEDGDGMMEAAFDDIEASRLEWQGDSNNVYNQTGSQLEKTRRLISPFNSHLSDTDAQIIKRLYTLFYREGDTLWGTKWDIINCVRYYLEIYDIFIVNNAQSYESSVLSNGNFEENTGSESEGTLAPAGWTLSGSVAYSSEDDEHFEESHGVAFTGSDGVCSQSVTLSASSLYFLHFFLTGSVRVAIVDPSGLYWNADDGAWQEDEYYNAFSNTSEEDWQQQSLHFTTGDGGSYEVRFAGGEDESTGAVDLVMLFLHTTSPEYLLVAVFNGDTSVVTEGANYMPYDEEHKGDEVLEAENPDWDWSTFSRYGPDVIQAGMDYSLIGFYPGLSGTFTKWLLVNEILKVLSPAGVSYYVEILDRASSS